MEHNTTWTACHSPSVSVFGAQTTGLVRQSLKNPVVSARTITMSRLYSGLFARFPAHKISYLFSSRLRLMSIFRGSKLRTQDPGVTGFHGIPQYRECSRRKAFRCTMNLLCNTFLTCRCVAAAEHRSDAEKGYPFSFANISFDIILGNSFFSKWNLISMRQASTCSVYN